MRGTGIPVPRIRRGQGLLLTVTPELGKNCFVESRRTLVSLHLALRIERRSDQLRHDRKDDGLKDRLRAECPDIRLGEKLAKGKRLLSQRIQDGLMGPLLESELA